jgi:hypothetical protein
MIDPLRQSTDTRAARGYAGTMAGFWSGLSGTLRALDAIAVDGSRLDESALGPLRTLQYRLHWSSELLDGVRPPAGARDAHDELRASLADARDATAEMVETIEIGGNDAASELIFEWRGALFRVRLARMRLGVQPEPKPPPGKPHYRAAAATGLAVLGAAAFLAGAVLIVWPLWAAGIALVAGALLVQRS